MNEQTIPPNITPEENRRRADLITKRHTDGLAPGESTELEDLQDRSYAYHAAAFPAPPPSALELEMCARIPGLHEYLHGDGPMPEFPPDRPQIAGEKGCG